jgi:low affinity Fe/Cu permease
VSLGEQLRDQTATLTHRLDREIRRRKAAEAELVKLREAQAKCLQAAQELQEISPTASGSTAMVNTRKV